jgi:hypothetical protein
METNASPESQPIEMIRFMLPAMCHFSANDESRKILVDNHMQYSLVRFYSILWKRCLADSSRGTDSKTSLVTLLGVLLNFAVTEPKLAKEDPSFLELQANIMLNLPQMLQSSENVDIIAHLVVLGLMLTRHQKKARDCSNAEFLEFFKSAIHFLKEANMVSCSAETLSPLSTACQTDWTTISELWFLGVQVLTACVEQFHGLDELVKDSGWLDEIHPNSEGPLKQAQGVDKDSLDTLLGLYNVVMAAKKGD